MISSLRDPVVIAGTLATVAGALPLFLTTTLSLRIGSELPLSSSWLGFAAALYFGVSAVVSVPVGRLVHRQGWKRGVLGSAMLSFFALVAIGLSTPTKFQFLVLLCVAGAANAVGQPAANWAILERSSEGSEATPFGIKQAAIPGSLLVSGAFVALLPVGQSWRIAYFAAALVPVTSAALIVGSSPPGSAPRRGSSRGLDLGSGDMTRWAIVGGLGAAAGTSLGSFLVVGSVDAGVTEAQAGAVLVGASVVGLLVRLASGYWVDRVDAAPLRLVSRLILLGMFGFVGLAVSGHLWAIAVFGTVAFAGGWGWPGMFHYGIVSRYSYAPAAATASVQVGAYLGALAGPLVFGVLADSVGFRSAWTYAALLLAGSLWMYHVASQTTLATHERP